MRTHMVSEGILNKAQNDAFQLAKELGVTATALTSTELLRWGNSFDRALVLEYQYREIIDILNRHMKELMLGAQIAKAQMKAEIDGELPSSGKVGGPLPIRAAYVGIGDDWEDAQTITTGSVRNWIHAGTVILAGIAGNPIRVMDNAVFVVIGIGTLHPSPKLEGLQFTIDGKQKPSQHLGWATKNSGLRVKEFDSAYIWKMNTTVLAQIFATAIYGATITDQPYLIGAAYIAEAQVRILDPASLIGTASARTVNKVIDVT